MSALPPAMAGLRDQARRRAALWRDEPVYRAAVRGRLYRPYRVRQFAAFGDGSFVHKPAWIYGAHKIEIGARVMILNGAWLSAERQTWDTHGPAITIGDGAAIRAWATLSASCRITIGSDAVFGAGCSIVDSDHTWRSGSDNVLHSPFVAEEVRIGRGTWLGDRVTVVRGATIGQRCAIGAGSVVRGEIPDGSIAVGAPARVVGRTENL